MLEMSERLKVKPTDELRELASRIPQLASSTRELEGLIMALINRLQMKTPSETRDHRGDRPADMDQASRRPYPVCVGQFWL